MVGIFRFLVLAQHADHGSIDSLIKEIEKRRKQRKKLVNAAGWAHDKAYHEVAKELLENKEGELEYEKLNESKFQEKFAKKLIDKYIANAKKRFKADPKDELEKEMLTKMYSGVNEGIIKERLAAHGEKYTTEQHSKYKEDFLENLTKELTTSVYTPLQHEHIPGVVKHIGVGEAVNAEKMRKEDIIPLLENFYDIGKLSEKVIPKHFLYRKKSRGS
ncbi:hypothetical protein HY638_00705 [Candidatus Woesearchaeota archaeon]|nr:hypothetical protein [Candidatus Woesearchaeota archaeon]